MKALPLNTIVVGLDAEGHARPALQRALELQKGATAKVHAFHGIPPALGLDAAFSAHDVAEVYRGAREAAEAHLREVYGEALDQLVKLGGKVLVEVGAPSFALGHACRALEAELLLIGPHARHRWVDFGQTARGLLSDLPCPLWIQVEGDTKIERVVVPIDLSSECDKVLGAGLQWAQYLNVPVHVLYAFSPPDFLKAAARGGSASNHTIVDEVYDFERSRFDAVIAATDFGSLKMNAEVVEGAPAEVILDALAPSDLLVIGTHGRSPLGRLFLGSVAHVVLKRVKNPTVVVPVRRPVST